MILMILLIESGRVMTMGGAGCLRTSGFTISALDNEERSIRRAFLWRTAHERSRPFSNKPRAERTKARRRWPGAIKWLTVDLFSDFGRDVCRAIAFLWGRSIRPGQFCRHRLQKSPEAQADRTRDCRRRLENLPKACTICSLRHGPATSGS